MGTAESLERARIRVEQKVLLDHCVITLDPQGFSDDSFDRSTLTWTRPLNDDAQVYTGPCSVKHDPRRGRIEDIDGEDTVSGLWIAKILLLESALVKEGALLLVDASRDPELIGRTFKVDEVHAGTFKITRPLHLSALLPSPAEWSDR